MYGLVNGAIQDLIIHAHGEAAWERIRQRAGVTAPRFIAMTPYPDSVTADLVAAASAELQVTAEQVLEQFGQWWLSYAASHGYGPLIGTIGHDFVTFMANLNEFHDRLRSMFPRFAPPRLVVEVLDEHRFHLHYHSHRLGLTPFLIGLVRGLGQRFRTEVDIRHLQVRGPDHDHDVFLITHHRQEA